MTEDGFQLTPLDIRTQQFRRVVRGYDPAIVEEFRDRIATELERLLREKAVTEEQVRSFREQLKTFREREKALSEALVVAEQLRHGSEQRANAQAEATVREARTDAANILNEARQAEQAVLRDLEASQRQLAAYLASFRVLLERNLAEVEAAETQVRNASQPGASRNSLGTTPPPVPPPPAPAERPLLASEDDPPIRLANHRAARPASEDA